MEEIDQLQREWMLINAARETLSLVKKIPNIAYVDAIKFAKENAEVLFSESSIEWLKKSYLDKLFDKYKEEAIAKSNQTKREVTPNSLIKARIEELDNILKYYPEEEEYPQGLKKEYGDLQKLIKTPQDEILNLVRITENNAIRYDVMANRFDWTFLNSHMGKFHNYLDKEGKNTFRIRIFHPDKLEAITGADLIYEQYDSSRKKVRIAAMQYKIWDKKVFYFSKAGNILAQMRRMDECFCKQKLCKAGELVSDPYRLPYCAAFLRPTDKLQNPNKPITSGYHMPICCLKAQVESNPTKMDLNTIQQYSIKSTSFEELFNSCKVGSRWLPIEDLEAFYRSNKVLEDAEKIVLYVQNAPYLD